MIARLKNRAPLGLGVIEEGEMFGFQDSKVAVIQIMIAKDGWDKVREDLTAKLGEPTKEMPQTYQNAFGARYEFSSGFWQATNLVVFAREIVASSGGHGLDSLFGPREARLWEASNRCFTKVKSPFAASSVCDRIVFAQCSP
jgi:hypothetical protein